MQQAQQQLEQAQQQFQQVQNQAGAQATAQEQQQVQQAQATSQVQQNSGQQQNQQNRFQFCWTMPRGKETEQKDIPYGIRDFLLHRLSSLCRGPTNKKGYCKLKNEYFSVFVSK
ncbi:hypothetical protein ACFX4I_18220 [Peribacillus sp. YIM B13472]|uniref:hypothetical protein n=1 Tax=Peribacillus sp. YIM B13472 TaxID=3366297 RepID=UPI00366B61D4